MVFRVRAVAVAAALCALADGSRLAQAQPEKPPSAKEKAVLDRMVELNQKALEAFSANKHEAAKDGLLEAVVLGKEKGLGTHQMMARTYLHIGVVYLRGLKDREKAVRYFGMALKLRPDIQITPSLVTPGVREAFEAAKDGKDSKDGKDAKPGSESAGVEKPADSAKPAEPTVASAPSPAPVEAKPSAEKAAVPQKGREAATTATVAAAPPPAPPAKPAAPAPASSPKPAAPPAPPAKPAVAASASASTVAMATRPPPELEEPDLPARVPTPLYCPTPDEGPPEHEMAVRCVTQPTLRVTRVVLFFRPSTQEKWKSTPMSKTKKGWYTGVVPAESAVGSALQYYVEARNGPRLTASAGRDESPNFVMLKAGAAPVGRGALAALRLNDRREAAPKGPEESPLDIEEKEKARAAEEARDRRRRAGAFFVGVGVGSGLGLHFGRMLEHRKDKEMPPGFTPAGLGHVSPEVGYQWSDQLAITIQSRHQWIPSGGYGDFGTQGYPPKSAHAVFARAYYYWRDFGDLQLVGTATVGGGTAFRLRVPPNDSEDPDRRLQVNDTIAGGPVALGPGALALYHFSRSVCLAADLKLLAGVPKFVALFDLTIGPQITF